MIRRTFILVTLAATILTTVVFALAQKPVERVQPQRQVEISPEVIRGIRNRPVRVIAKPFNIAIADIIVELANQPDADLRPNIKQFGHRHQESGESRNLLGFRHDVSA